MGHYIVKITNPRYLTTEEEITLGAKNIFDLVRVIIKYSRKYMEFNVKIR